MKVNMDPSKGVLIETTERIVKLIQEGLWKSSEVKEVGYSQSTV